MKKVVTFGEIMLRVSPPGFQRFTQTSLFEILPGGGEANVAVSLAQLGMPAAFVTKLPSHDIGEIAVQALRKYGVDTSHIVRGGERVGIYFCEKGASQRASQVIYDRANAAVTSLSPEEISWKEIFKDARWFHVTGITPALSESCAQRTLEAVREAKNAGVPVSCDLNYRKKLWSTEQAGKVMAQIVPHCDVVIGNEEDIEKVFGIKPKSGDVTKGQIDREAHIGVVKEFCERFKPKAVALTLRESFSASENGWSALFWDGKEAYFSRTYKIHVVDRVGGGDAFAAGLIYSLASGYPPAKAVEFAVAASCLKHTIEGDFNLLRLSEVETLLKGDGSGRVQR